MTHSKTKSKQKENVNRKGIYATFLNYPPLETARVDIEAIARAMIIDERQTILSIIKRRETGWARIEPIS